MSQCTTKGGKGTHVRLSAHPLSTREAAGRRRTWSVDKYGKSTLDYEHAACLFSRRIVPGLVGLFPHVDDFSVCGNRVFGTFRIRVCGGLDSPESRYHMQEIGKIFFGSSLSKEASEAEVER